MVCDTVEFGCPQSLNEHVGQNVILEEVVFIDIENARLRQVREKEVCFFELFKLLSRPELFANLSHGIVVIFIPQAFHKLIEHDEVLPIVDSLVLPINNKVKYFSILNPFRCCLLLSHQVN